MVEFKRGFKPSDLLNPNRVSGHVCSFFTDNYSDLDRIKGLVGGGMIPEGMSTERYFSLVNGVNFWTESLAIFPGIKRVLDDSDSKLAIKRDQPGVTKNTVNFLQYNERLNILSGFVAGLQLAEKGQI